MIVSDTFDQPGIRAGLFAVRQMLGHILVPFQNLLPFLSVGGNNYHHKQMEVNHGQC